MNCVFWGVGRWLLLNLVAETVVVTFCVLQFLQTAASDEIGLSEILPAGREGGECEVLDLIFVFLRLLLCIR